jgi:hypothetical protein
MFFLKLQETKSLGSDSKTGTWFRLPIPNLVWVAHYTIVLLKMLYKNYPHPERFDLFTSKLSTHFKKPTVCKTKAACNDKKVCGHLEF